MNKGLEALEKIKNLPMKDQYINDRIDGFRYCVVNDICNKEIKIIETTLKNYEELTSKSVIWYERTHGSSQALIDTICKNYKEIKITNLEDENKLKALNEILALHDKWLGNEMSDFEFFTLLSEARNKYALSEEVLIDG